MTVSAGRVAVSAGSIGTAWPASQNPERFGRTGCCAPAFRAPATAIVTTAAAKDVERMPRS
jgi:hypothetical protein